MPAKRSLQRVAIARQAEREGVLVDREAHRAGAAPTLLGIVEELGDRSVDGRAGRSHFEFHPHVVGSLAAQHVVAHLARVEFLLEARGQAVQHAGIQLLPDQRRQVLAQARS